MKAEAAAEAVDDIESKDRMRMISTDRCDDDDDKDSRRRRRYISV